MLTPRAAASLIVVVTFTLCVVPSNLAFGQPTGGAEHLTVTVMAGIDPVAGGMFTRGAESQGRWGSATNFARSFREVQDAPVHLAVDIGYARWRSAEIMARIAFTSAASKGPFDYGDSWIRDTGKHFKLTAVLSGYRAWTVQGGVRRVWRRGAVDSYFGGLAGVTVVHPMTLQEITDIRTIGGPFFARSVPLTLTGMVGIAVGISRRLSVGVESGVHYQAPLTVDAAASNYTIGPLNYYGLSRWSVPVTGTVRCRF